MLSVVGGAQRIHAEWLPRRRGRSRDIRDAPAQLRLTLQLVLPRKLGSFVPSERTNASQRMSKNGNKKSVTGKSSKEKSNTKKMMKKKKNKKKQKQAKVNPSARLREIQEAKIARENLLMAKGAGSSQRWACCKTVPEEGQ